MNNTYAACRLMLHNTSFKKPSLITSYIKLRSPILVPPQPLLTTPMAMTVMRPGP